MDRLPQCSPTDWDSHHSLMALAAYDQMSHPVDQLVAKTDFVSSKVIRKNSSEM